MTNIVVAYHTGYGNTGRVARAVADGAGASLLNVAEIDAEGWSRLAAADAIVFGSPTYMGGVSAPFKAFADATSATYSARGWQDKLAAGFTNSAALNGDKLATLQFLAQFAAQHGMQWVSLGLPSPTPERPGDNRLGSYLGLMTQSGPDGPAQADLDTAALFGARIAAAAARWSLAAVR